MPKGLNTYFSAEIAEVFPLFAFRFPNLKAPSRLGVFAGTKISCGLLVTRHSLPATKLPSIPNA